MKRRGITSLRQREMNYQDDLLIIGNGSPGEDGASLRDGVSQWCVTLAHRLRDLPPKKRTVLGLGDAPNSTHPSEA